MQIDEEYLKWHGLLRFIDDFKKWVLRLFLKAHARMGHIEEELAKVSESQKQDYWLLPKSGEKSSIKYVLYEKVSKTEHGSISLDASGGVISVWDDDVNETLN